MAIRQFVAIEGTEGQGVTSITVTLPSAPLAGSWLVAFVALNGDNTVPGWDTHTETLLESESGNGGGQGAYALMELDDISGAEITDAHTFSWGGATVDVRVYLVEITEVPATPNSGSSSDGTWSSGTSIQHGAGYGLPDANAVGVSFGAGVDMNATGTWDTGPNTDSAGVWVLESDSDPGDTNHGVASYYFSSTDPASDQIHTVDWDGDTKRILAASYWLEQEAAATIPEVPRPTANRVEPDVEIPSEVFPNRQPVVVVDLAADGDVAADGTASLSVATGLVADGDVAADGDAAVSVLTGIVAAGDTAADGAAAVGVTTGIVGSGDTAADGAAAVGVTTGIVGSGDTAADGTVGLSVVTAVVADGDVAADGTASLSVDTGIVASGDVAADGTADLTVVGQPTPPVLVQTVELEPDLPSELGPQRPFEEFLVASGDVAADGTASLSVTTGIAGSGDVAADGAADLDVTTGLVSSGDTAADGAASLSVTTGLAGSGDTAADGATNLAVSTALVADGDVAVDGDANLTIQGQIPTPLFPVTLEVEPVPDQPSELGGFPRPGTTVTLAADGHVAGDGAVDLGIGTAVEGAGQVAADGTSVLVVSTAISGSGDTAADGVAVLGVATGLVADGDTAADGLVDLTVWVYIAADGDTAADGTSNLSITTALVADGDVAADGTAAIDRTRGLSAGGDVAADGDGRLRTVGTTFWQRNKVAGSATTLGTKNRIAGDKVDDIDNPPW